MRQVRIVAALLVGLLLALVGAAAASADVAERRTVLVVDTSGSMVGAKLAAARQGALSYAAAVPSDVSVGVVTFADGPKVLLKPTPSTSAVKDALTKLVAQGHTTLYDGVIAGLRLAGTKGERHLVIVSDGQDTSSKATLDSTVAAIKAAKIAVSVVEVNATGEASAALRRLAAAGSGKVVVAKDANEVADRLAEAPKPAVEVPVEALPELPTSPELRWVLGVAFVVLLGLLGLVFWSIGRWRAKERARRLVTGYGDGPVRVSSPDGALYDKSPIMGAAFRLAAKVAARRSLGERLTLLLGRAGMSLKPAEWLLVQFSVSVGTVALSVLLFGILGLLVGVVVGFGGTYLWLTLKAGRRRNNFEARLPDALQLLASGLASGFAFSQALDSVARRGPEPVAAEFARALAESRLGTPVEDALDRTAARMDSRDLELTVMSIRIQREVGGNLAEVLRTTVATMRERTFLRSQVRTLSAEGRLSAYILIALPLGLAAFLFLVRGEYLRPLYTSTLGLVMIGAAAISMTIGALVMRKIVKVDV